MEFIDIGLTHCSYCLEHATDECHGLKLHNGCVDAFIQLTGDISLLNCNCLKSCETNPYCLLSNDKVIVCEGIYCFDRWIELSRIYYYLNRGYFCVYRLTDAIDKLADYPNICMKLTTRLIKTLKTQTDRIPELERRLEEKENTIKALDDHINEVETLILELTNMVKKL